MTQRQRMALVRDIVSHCVADKMLRKAMLADLAYLASQAEELEAK